MVFLLVHRAVTTLAALVLSKRSVIDTVDLQEYGGGGLVLHIAAAIDSDLDPYTEVRVCTCDHWAVVAEVNHS